MRSYRISICGPKASPEKDTDIIQYGTPEKAIIERLIGLAGDTTLFLCGRWWETLSALLLSAAITSSLNTNRNPPVVIFKP